MTIGQNGTEFKRTVSGVDVDVIKSMKMSRVLEEAVYHSGLKQWGVGFLHNVSPSLILLKYP